MKKIQILLMMLFLSNITFFVLAQKSVVEGVKEYKDIKEKMYISSVIEVEGKTKKDLMNAFKNWGGVTFNNFREVIVSETDDQIVLVYTTSVPRITKVLLTTNTNLLKQYVRMIVEFKDGKVRLSFYDDGNVFIPSSYAGNIPIPGAAARSYYMSDIYNNLIKYENEWDYKKPESEKDYLKLKNSNYKFIMAYQADIEKTLSSAIEGIKNSNNIKRKDDF
jgi:hypothetical protein